MNSTYWAPFPAHNTREVQELAMGLINSKAQKVDLNMAPGTKHCEYKEYIQEASMQLSKNIAICKEVTIMYVTKIVTIWHSLTVTSLHMSMYCLTQTNLANVDISIGFWGSFYLVH